MNNGCRRTGALMLAAALTLTLGSCAAKPREAADDIITQTVPGKDKIPVTVLVKYAFSINTFEKAAEEKFPEIDIIQVGNYTGNMGLTEYEARMEHDDLTDIVMTWPLEIGEEYWEERLIDLSPLPLTGRYTTSMLNDISRDGKLFYLPGPAQLRGIVYNKTLFAENGWEVPRDFEGFIALCGAIEASGMRSLQLGLKNAEVLDTAFVGFGFESGYSSPRNTQFIRDYNSGKGSFGDNFTPALETFKRLIDEGILRKEDIDIDYSAREKLLFERGCAMIEDSVLMARMGEEYNGCTDEFALMPFFNPGADADWARLYPVCYIGLNKKLEQPESKAKYELVMRLMDYISTPEGQEALSGDTGAMISSLNGVAPPDIPEIADLLPTLAAGRYSRFPTLKNAQGALREGLAGMVSGTHTTEDVIKLVDAENMLPPLRPVPIVLGTAETDFSLIDTGSLVTDAMRDYSGCDVALFLDNGKDGRNNGKGISGRIYKGGLTASDITRVMPDLKMGEKCELWKVTMTGADLLTTLEYAIPVNNDAVGWFYYFSGLKLEYAPAAKQGERIRSVTDGSGKPIDPQKLYSVAVMDYSAPEEFFKSCEKTGVFIPDIVSAAISKQKTISPAADGRFTVCEP